MKFSFMSFSTPDLDLAAILEAARRYGYEGIEPRLDSKHAHGIEVTATQAEREAICDQVRKSGVELVCLAASLRYADPSLTEAMVRDTHERIDLAADLGVPVIRVFGGPLPEGMDREKATDLVAGSLASVADHAGERGVAVCMETHDDWCLPAHVAEVMRRVNHPAIAVNWDIMHPVRRTGTSIDDSFETLKPWIRHLHIHDGITKEDGSLQMVPIGSGLIDHRRALERIRSIDYKGAVSGEWIRWEPYEEHLPREIATLRSYL